MQGERHYAFLHEKKMVRQIRNQVRSGARACAGHRAVLGYLVANEIPASIVRWHGARAVEKFVKQLHDEVKEQDPEALVSYANYPSPEGLDFCLTSRTRQPKQALSVVRKVFEEVPFSSEETWPKISVVVCTFNGRRTIRECLEGIGKLHYPNYETIVVDDGSTDGAGDIAAEYDVRLIRTENQGLSAARNLGWQSATGEIVAYIDDYASH